MENLKGCNNCKHMQMSSYTPMCTHPSIVKKYTHFNYQTGLYEHGIYREEAWQMRSDFSGGKCKREAIYFEPTKYYQFKQWIKQQFNQLFNHA